MSLEAGAGQYSTEARGFAEFLTLSPSSVTQQHVQELRNVGWSDEEIIDIVHITALFNYMVRVADGLGIELNEGRNWENQQAKLSFKDAVTGKSFGDIAGTAGSLVNRKSKA